MVISGGNLVTSHYRESDGWSDIRALHLGDHGGEGFVSQALPGNFLEAASRGRDLAVLVSRAEGGSLLVVPSSVVPPSGCAVRTP
jgi:hypothetical protein